jgi:CHRD domain-containing protein
MRVRAAAIAAAAGVLAVVLVGVVGAGAQGGAQQSKALFAVLTGAKEPEGGDPNGRGSFTAIVDGNQLCYGLTNRNIEDPTAAHIHRGRAGVAGDVVVPLQQPSSGDPGASSDCVRVARSLSRAILRNPNRYYVNVHTAGLPDGAIRGQLFARQR